MRLRKKYCQDDGHTVGLKYCQDDGHTVGLKYCQDDGHTIGFKYCQDDGLPVGLLKQLQSRWRSKSRTFTKLVKMVVKE